MEQVEVLNEYYTNLDYDKSDKIKIQKEIYTLFESIKFDCNVEMPDRLNVLADLINKNLLLFMSIFKHTDVIHTILDYLTNYSTKINNKMEVETCEFDEIPCLLVLTLITICRESVIQTFFLDSLIDTSPDILSMYQQIDSMLNCDLKMYFLDKHYTESEMIILEDSDLYAVINCLMITDQFPLYKIWVQKSVKKKFLWLTRRYNLNLSINIFKSLQNIQFRPYDKLIISIVSIWSENIVAAKNLALSLNSHVVFINTYMDFCGGTVFLPFKEIIQQNLNEQELNAIHQNESVEMEPSVNVIHLSQIAKINSTSICDLFYDGTWQKPVKGMYWKHNDSLWANATNDDIKNCYESAKKGFETWSIKSIKTRIEILSQFVPTLKHSGKIVLAAIVERWLKFPYLYESIRGYHNQDKMIEVMHTRKPLGVIILKEENENVLFFRLMQILIAGNSVIVMSDAHFCDLSSYYDMFSTCGIPPGVINLLLHENTETMEYKLCLQEYIDYANKYFLKGTSKQTYIVPYRKLTIPKQIILHLK